MKPGQENRSGVHRPQPQIVGQEVTEGRAFAHGHGQPCNGVVLAHGLGGAVSLNRSYRRRVRVAARAYLQHAEELASVHSARMGVCSSVKIQKLTARRNQKFY